MIDRSLLAVALAAALVAAPGCATGSGSGPDTSRDTITREQLAEYPAQTALQVVRRLHPNWVQIRGQSTIRSGDDPVVVYIEDSREPDGAAALRRLQSNQVQEIVYVDPRTAFQRFGYGHSSGALMVTLIR